MVPALEPLADPEAKRGPLLLEALGFGGWLLDCESVTDQSLFSGCGRQGAMCPQASEAQQGSPGPCAPLPSASQGLDVRPAPKYLAGPHWPMSCRGLGRQ